MGTQDPDGAIGRLAPPLTLPRADGGTFQLGELAGRATLITFLSHAA